MTKKILIVEDEPRLLELHRDYLQRAGYGTECLADGTQVVARVKKDLPVLIVLDLMLPGRNGLDICKEIRRFSAVPIIMVTARIEEIDRLLGLELGADDYICKPFSPREVVARVKAVLRRSPASVEHATFLHMDEERYLAAIEGKELDLTAVEFQLLSILAGRPGRIFNRDQLMDRIYNDRRIVCDRTIDSHIKKLRKKIAAAAPGVDVVHSVYGVGYKYEVP